MQLSLFRGKHSIEPGETRTCRLCKVTKNVKDFVQSERYVKLECRKCLTNLEKLRNVLREKHPYPSEDYVCPICKNTAESLGHLSTRTKIWSLDHCYTTDSFRGYLCMRCNMGLGQLQDDIPTLKRAIKYLTAAGKKNKSNEVTTRSQCTHQSPSK